MKKLFTLSLIFVMLFGSIAYGQSQNALAKKTDSRGIISKQKKGLRAKAGTVVYYEDFSTGEIPEGWTVVDNNGAGQVWRFDNPGDRVILTSTADNGFAIFDSDYFAAEPGSSDFISPVIDCSQLVKVGVSFEHYFNHLSTSIGEIFVSLDDGVNWTSLVQYTADSQNGELVEYDLTSIIAGESLVRFKFRYEGDDEWYWAIDDLTLFIPNDHDMMVTAITPLAVEPGGSYIPTVTVKNNGYLEATTFDITITSTDGYNETFTVTETIAPGDEATIDCPEWIPTGQDNYLLTAEVIIVGDGLEGNNTMDHGVLCLTYNYEENTIYGFKNWDEFLGPYQTVTIKPNGEYTVLSDVYGLAGYFCGAAYIEGIVYGMEVGTGNIYVLDDCGLGAPVGTISGIEGIGSVVGFSYDAKNEIAYMTTFYDNGLGLLTSTLLTLDMNTFEATPVGTINNSLIISIETGNDGEIWGMDMLTDNVWSINPQTGEGTIIGDLGFDIHYHQDLVFDPISGTLYAALCFASDVGGMYEIDKETGAATLLGNFDPDCEMSAMTITTGYVLSDDADIIAFDFNDFDPAVIGTVDAADYTVDLEVPEGTDVTALVATFVLSDYATVVDQVSGTTANDFTDDVTYTVMAEAGNTQDWTVSVDVLTGIDNPFAEQFNIYPNPVTDEIIFAGVKGECSVEIYNVIGQKVIDIPNLGENQAVNVKSLEIGTYIVKVVNNEGLPAIKKILKK